MNQGNGELNPLGRTRMSSILDVISNSRSLRRWRRGRKAVRQPWNNAHSILKANINVPEGLWQLEWELLGLLP